MNLNNQILKFLSILSKVDSLKKVIKKINKKMTISEFIVIDENSIRVFDIELGNKININDSLKTDFRDIEKFDKFIHKVFPNIIRLNHVGISYYCLSIKEEMMFYKKRLGTNPLYEETSGNTYSRWFFLGEISKWENPLFEIVLNKGNTEYINEWIPHFQIDLDTNLQFNEIKKITNEIYGENFIKWSLDVPNFGVVLCMGRIFEVGNTKMYLGIGTNLRNTRYHRNELLKKV